MAGKKEIKLVPVEEQPYDVPQNWCWVYLTAGFAECMDSFRKPINATERATRIGSVPYYGATGQVGWIDDYLTDEHLVLVGEDGAPFLDLLKEKAYIIEGKAWVNNHAHILRSHYGKTGNIFLMNYLNIFDFTNYVNGTTRLKLTQASMNTIPTPLAPLAEQKRIVDTITELFADLDKAVENARKIIEKHKAKKESILYQAFSGKLTSQWRKEKGLGYDKWQDRTLEDVSYSIYDGDHMPPPKAENGVPFLMISNVNTGYLSFDNTKYVTQDYYDNLSETRKPRNGDVLYTLVGSYGISVVVDTDTPFCFQRHMAVIKPRDIDTRFLWYQMQSQEIFNKATSIATGTAQLTVPIKGLRQMTIKVPTLDEQQEIVRILDELLTDEQRIKEAAEETLAKIDLMKKSILADAFRGKLGTNDPSDQPATELLKQILA